MTAPETSVIAWGNTQLPYTIRRSNRRRKTVAVSIDAVGSVLVAAPADFPTPEIDAVVRRKAAWIGMKFRGVESQHAPPGPREFVSGESVLYLGRHYRLKVLPHGDGPAKLRGRWLHVPAGAGECQPDRVRDALISWLRLRAEERLPERVDAWCAKVGVAMPPGLGGKPAQALGQLRQPRHHPPQLAYRASAHALGGLCGRPRARTPAAPRPRARLLASRWARHAGLRAATQGTQGDRWPVYLVAW